MTTDEDIEERREAEAASWFTTMHSGEVDRETRAWLHADRAHKVAYREFEQAYRDLAYVAVEAGVDLDEALGRKRRGWRMLLAEWAGKPAFGRRFVLPAFAGALATALVFLANVDLPTRAPEQLAKR